MRLDFKILWFENQPDDVKTQVEEIADYLRTVGFVPHIEMQLDGGEVENLGKIQELYDEYDLVVVDYDLGHPGKNGDWVAQQIRRHFGFTDIIFYSGKKPGDLRRMVFDCDIDGVYCFNRPDLAEKLAIHIDQVTRRLSRLEAMRGLAMGIVGRCDDELRSLLTFAHEKSGEAEKAALEQALDRLVTSARETGQKKFEKCTSFGEKLLSRSVTSFTLFKMAMVLLDGKEHCVTERKTLASYDPDVLEPRNRLAHAIETRTDTGWAVETDDKPTITLADFPSLRNSLAMHLTNIRSLAPLLTDARQEA
ncbi:hypothetical protein GCM10023219_29400 [Stakelama sediminis]|uniref:Response regulatory domain-containing protein n=1 Tax=Stakelama sediminis TaxID=463200 RepID=A0A840Z3N5_9SPHN|nr:response regulator [Stakelama sediminis]MBB5720252.1 hypothetical protein [Stakelama sediminis]